MNRTLCYFILDSVDEKLLKVDGKIFRGRDPLLCTHGMHGMCDYCEPLDPFDSHLYLMTENKLNTAKTEENTTINTVSKLPTFKHMSFHAWLRQLSIEKSGSLQNYLSGNPLIEEPRYTVDLTCKNHAPYPKAICSACQVPPITLRVQPYRMVDHVEFEDASGFLVDDFVKGWRQSGYQVYGILFGYYDGISTEESPDGNISKSTTSISSPPLGIKAVVQGIFEPLQEGSLDGFELLMDSDIGTSLGRLFEKSLHYFGLKVLGHIYTDLRPKERDQLADMGATSSTNASRDGVAFLRNKNSFFVSGFECQFMAEQQSKLPFSPCPWPFSWPRP